MSSELNSGVHSGEKSPRKSLFRSAQRSAPSSALISALISTLAVALAALILVGACSSKPKKNQPVADFWPPFEAELDSAGGTSAGGSVDPDFANQRYEQILRDHPGDAERAWVRYRQAKLWDAVQPARACRYWLEASSNPRFPLRSVARMHGRATCKSDQAAGAQDSLNERHEDGKETWLRELNIKAQLQQAKSSSDHNTELVWLKKSVWLEKTQTGQLRVLAQAKELAHGIGDLDEEEEIQNTIERIAPRKILEPRRDQLFAVALDLKRAREFDQARQYFRAILQSKEFTDLEKLKSLDGIRMTYKLDNRRDLYLVATREYADYARAHFFVKSSKKPFRGQSRLLAKYLETRISLARVTWTESSAFEAMAILKEIETELKGRLPLDDVYFLEARIEEELGHLDQSAILLNRVNERHITDRGFRLRLRWARAWNLKKSGHLEQAAAILESQADEEDSPSLSARDHFWTARISKDLGRTEIANQQFNWLLENDPLGFYGAVAARELKLRLPRLGGPRKQRPEPTGVIRRSIASLTRDFALDPRLQESVHIVSSVEPDMDSDTQYEAEDRAESDEIESTAHLESSRAPSGAPARVRTSLLTKNQRMTFEWLLAVEENDLARSYLNSIGAQKRIRGQDPLTAIEAVEAYARAGSYQSLFASLGDLPPSTRQMILEKKPELIFPQPWTALVGDAARASGVPVELIYSITRQESSFDPHARSPADAYGLMQLIPEMATRAAKAAGHQDLASPEELYQPALNIKLGSFFLRETLNKWDGRFIPSVASYNASEKAVTGWLRTRDRSDPLQFIEEIPYEETRGYVKLVMRNFIFYSRLNTLQDSIAFPEWCLAGLQDFKP